MMEQPVHTTRSIRRYEDANYCSLQLGNDRLWQVSR
jgi:hypothetical protein